MLKPEYDKKKIFVNISLAVIFIALMIYATVRFAPYVTRLIHDPDKFRDLILSYGALSVWVFILFQILQVVIAPIPGEFVQIGGGYIYGTIGGTVYSVIGILLGSLLIFFFTRLLGQTLVKVFVSDKDLEKFSTLINSPRSEIVMFLLFLIPGMPKDILVYISGLTPVKPLRFFLIFITARFPAIFFSAYIGANLETRNYLPAIITSVLACALFAVGLVKQNQLIDRMHDLMNRWHMHDKSQDPPQ